MKKDLRVIKTQDNIQSNFIKLLEQYSFQEITIKILIDECRINRSTFYRNYEDKYDLINKMSEQLLNQFEKTLNPKFINLEVIDSNQLKPYFINMLDYFSKNKTTLLIMSHNNLPVNIFDEMLNTFSNTLLNEIKNNYHINKSNIKKASYFSRIIASNILTAMKWWHEESEDTTKEEMLNIITLTVTKGIFNSMQSQFAKTINNKIEKIS